MNPAGNSDQRYEYWGGLCPYCGVHSDEQCQQPGLPRREQQSCCYIPFMMRKTMRDHLRRRYRLTLVGVVIGALLMIYAPGSGVEIGLR